MSAPEPVRVSCWGELRGEKKIPGLLRVLVGGQHAGAIMRDGAVWYAGHRHVSSARSPRPSTRLLRRR